jgi:hypothetical protein
VCCLQVPLLYRMATVLDEKNPHADKRSRYLWKTHVSVTYCINYCSKLVDTRESRGCINY